ARIARLAAKYPVVVAHDLDDVVIRSGATVAGKARTLRFERENALRRVERPLVHPEIRHHRTDPRSDEALLLRIVAEREDHRSGPVTGHFRLAFAEDPQVADCANALRAGSLLRRLARLLRLGLERPVTDESVQPAMFVLWFYLPGCGFGFRGHESPPRDVVVWGRTCAVTLPRVNGMLRPVSWRRVRLERARAGGVVGRVSVVPRSRWQSPRFRAGCRAIVGFATAGVAKSVHAVRRVPASVGFATVMVAKLAHRLPCLRRVSGCPGRSRAVTSRCKCRVKSPRRAPITPPPATTLGRLC